ncbi:MAG: AI-2E family transporter [Thermodesulfobacteriota bacterium]|nr:AI-2E family transporter [Thermodesulfobacteriota bacterium]
MDGKDGYKMPESSSTQMIFRYFLIIFLLTIFLVGKVLWPYLSILVLAFVLTGIFYPVYRFFAQKIRPVLSSLITCTIIFLVVFVPLVFLVGSLSKEAYDLYLMGSKPATNQALKELLQNSHIVERIEGFLANYDIRLGAEHVNKALSELGRTVGLFLYEQVSTIASNVLKSVVSFALMLLIVFFLLIDGKRLVDFFVELSPLPEEQDRKLMEKFQAMASVVLVVNGISGLIQGSLGGALFAIFGLGSPLLWGSLMAVLAFLPILGIALVFIPASLYLFLKGRIGAGIFFLLFYLVVSSVMEYVIKPKLVGDKVQMHTLLVFLSIIGGLKVFGILGIIYGPLVITAFLTLTDIYRSSYETYIRKA